MTGVDVRERAELAPASSASAGMLDRWPLVIGSSLIRKPRRQADRLPIERHLGATLGWIEAAHSHSTDGGIPAYYDLLRGRWRPSYPETTGYMIPTLYACADRLARPALGALGTRLADYL